MKKCPWKGLKPNVHDDCSSSITLGQNEEMSLEGIETISKLSKSNTNVLGQNEEMSLEGIETIAFGSEKALLKDGQNEEMSLEGIETFSMSYLKLIKFTSE